MPGRAIGRTTRRFTDRWPKNRCLCNAKATSVPRITAITVAPAATSTELRRASRTGRLAKAFPHHCSEKSVTGQLAMRAALNEFSTTNSNGMYMYARTKATITPSTIFEVRDSLSIWSHPFQSAGALHAHQVDDDERDRDDGERRRQWRVEVDVRRDHAADHLRVAADELRHELSAPGS